MLALLLSLIALEQDSPIQVKDQAEFVRQVRQAKPGAKILLAPGEYRGGFHFSNVRGTEFKPITIGGADPSNPPKILGGNTGIQLSDVSYLELRDLIIDGPRYNGINIDDGGTPESSSHHVTLRNLQVFNLPKGNHDAIKLSGLDDFKVLNCRAQKWGGSGIDMVGCHRGEISGCTFREGGDSGVQTKGGSAQIRIVGCRFEDGGQRAVNIGGSTGLQFFRPPLSQVASGSRYEAKAITVEGCTFIGSMSPIAFVGADGATVRFNTIFNPDRWAIRILQETGTPDFVKCRNGVFESNLVVFRSDRWASGGVNVGGGTAPETFKFHRNFWYCSDRPERSKPVLPVTETSGVFSLDPRLVDPAAGNVAVKAGSPAEAVGAHAFKKRR